MFYKFCYLFLFFMIYSFLGYITEVISCWIHYKKLSLNRGFFIGPYIPIYGIVCVLFSALLSNFQDNILLLFIFSVLIGSIVEYLSSYLLEKIFNIRWWDYHYMKIKIKNKTIPLDINGRCCLPISLLFGVGGVCVITILNPLILYLLNKLSPHMLIIISTICMLVFITDLIISIVLLSRIKSSLDEARKNEDMTSEVKDLINKQLKKNLFLIRRLLNAFPHFVGKDAKILIYIKKLANKMKKTK